MIKTKNLCIFLLPRFLKGLTITKSEEFDDKQTFRENIRAPLSGNLAKIGVTFKLFSTSYCLHCVMGHVHCLFSFFDWDYFTVMKDYWIL